VRNPEDWPVEFLFRELGFFEASDQRAALFLEALISPDVRPDEESQRKFSKTLNGVLADAGIEMRETGTHDGYPLFKLAWISTAQC
jgi:hypothetical protein